MANGMRVLRTLLLVMLFLAVLWIVARPIRTVTVTEQRDVAIPFVTERVASDELPAGQEVVVQPGAQGLKVVYTYFEERSVFGNASPRTQVDPGDRPTESITREPTNEIVEFGTATDLTVDVSSSAESGSLLGVFGESGTLLINATGEIKYWKGGGAGPEGDPRHDYTFVPLRSDANVGALLVRVGTTGPYTEYSELPIRDGFRVLTGAPGERAMGVVNDAPGLFDDNTGSFSVRVVSE